MLVGFVVTAAALIKAHEVSHENVSTTVGVAASPAGATDSVASAVSDFSDSESSGSGSVDTAMDSVVSLQSNLSEEIDMLRQSLAQQQQTILELSRELATLKETPLVIGSAEIPAEVVAATVSPGPGDNPTTTNTGASPSRRGNASPPREALVQSGVDPGIADDITQRLDARALADLQIRDQAAREGWLDAPDFRERRDALLPERVSVRDELGTETFDRYLYNRGRNNRVVVSSVMSGSAAQIAGFLPGDMIYSYAGSQVFSMRELTRATRAGEAGAPTEVRVVRDGSAFILDVPRGPLGVTMAAIRVDPETAIE